MEGIIVDVSSTSDQLTVKDFIGSAAVRLGINRNTYRVEPGLYTLNSPDADDPVFVSANYKLSFDVLRSSLKEISCFILVLDTRGINVWCAAGKGTFGTEELVKQIKSAGLAERVNHRTLILPQLGAPGVAGYEIKRLTGFRVVYGPVEARDIQEYLKINMKKTPEMRKKKFGTLDRLILTPVELIHSWRIFLPVAAAGILFMLIASGFDAGRIGDVLKYSILAATAGVAGGGFLTPLFLPLLPGRAFSLKGFFAGVLMLLAWFFLTRPSLPALIFCGGLVPAVSSFIGMNFTGASTYTSLSGVRKEMRIAVPLQITVAVLACAGGILSAVFRGGLL